MCKSFIIFTFQSGYIPTFWQCILCQTCLSFTFQSGYIPTVLTSNHTHNQAYFTFQSGYIPTKVNTFHFSRIGNLYIPIWLYSNAAAPTPAAAKLSFTFQSGYIPTVILLNNGLEFQALHSNLVIFQHPLTPVFCFSKSLYIPIWLYSNPPTIIPHIYRLWKLLFVDLRFSIHPTAIFFASYSYYLFLDLYYSSFVYLPIFKVYHRLTIILVQLMFYINLV